jgi:anti-sigma B factor antagonist
MIDIKVVEEDDYCTIEVIGELDASSSVKLDTTIQETIDNNFKKILINCYKLDYISSPGIGVFTSRIDDQEKKQIFLVLFGVNEKVLNIFQILGLEQLLYIVNSIDEAKSLIDDLQKNR